MADDDDVPITRGDVRKRERKKIINGLIVLLGLGAVLAMAFVLQLVACYYVTSGCH